MIKTTNMLLEELQNYSDPYGKIRRLCQEGRLFEITRGLYETEKKINGYVLAPVIYGPSYLSFNYALSYHGLIPEAVYEYTSATCQKGKKKQYTNIFGTYSYRDIPAKAFPYETILLSENGYHYMMAGREKALCDKLYELKPVKNQNELEALLFEDMRVYEDEFLRLDHEIISELSGCYGSNNVKYLSAYLARRQR